MNRATTYTIGIGVMATVVIGFGAWLFEREVHLPELKPHYHAEGLEDASDDEDWREDSHAPERTPQLAQQRPAAGTGTATRPIGTHTRTPERVALRRPPSAAGTPIQAIPAEPTPDEDDEAPDEAPEDEDEEHPDEDIPPEDPDTEEPNPDDWEDDPEAENDPEFQDD